MLPLRILSLSLGAVRTPLSPPELRIVTTPGADLIQLIDKVRIQNPRNMCPRRYSCISETKTVSHLVAYTSALIVHFSRSKYHRQ